MNNECDDCQEEYKKCEECLKQCCSHNCNPPYEESDECYDCHIVYCVKCNNDKIISVTINGDYAMMCANCLSVDDGDTYVHIKYYHKQIKKMKKNCVKLSEDNVRLLEENAKLQAMVDYQPGGKGFEEAKEHFEELSEKLKK